MITEGFTTSPDAAHAVDLHAIVRKERLAAEAELDALRRKISDIGQIENSLLPPGRLPAEILVELFEILRDACSPDGPSWTHYTRVCRRWRAVALGSRKIWSTIWITSYTKRSVLYVSTSLERSQNLPLAIYIQAPDYCIGPHTFDQIACKTQMRDALKLHASRIYAFDADCFCSGDALGWVEFPMANLKDINIESTVVSQRPEYPVDYHTSSLNDHPNLKCITLFNAYMDWSYPLDRVRKLEITAPEHGDRPSEGDFWTALSKCNKLRRLRLDVAMPEDRAIGNPVSLPKLRSLSIEDTPQNITTFLDRVILPETCEVELQLDHGEAAIQDWLPIPSTSSILKRLTWAEVRVEEQLNSYFFGRDIMDIDDYSLLVKSKSSPSNMFVAGFMLSRAMEEIEKAFGSSPLQVIQFRTPDPSFNSITHADTTEWRRFLSKFPLLRSLAFTLAPSGTPDACPALLDALMPAADAASEFAQVASPRLEVLALSKDNIPAVPDFHAKLLECLDARATAGSPLKLLVFMDGMQPGAAISVEEVECLKQRVTVWSVGLEHAATGILEST
ncbi:hypothetical protein CERSUDRAFT_92383 [Gelatoporia subvermispora B]|uniref:F-box domain-containing protein n=1 Tax=Ceriporiopsis subvermispora (strain B) TaxID=914234 RepID=M2R5P7_CERS8|nr:hypothetical protein CERSUDRAFT_92383 [Gelatoporia subvermispora B]